MTKSNSLIEPPAGVVTVLRSYADVLGQQPQLWRQHAAGWEHWDGDVDGAMSTWSDAIVGQLESGPLGSDGIVASLEGRALVALPVEDDRHEWAAVSVLEASDLPLVRRLASAALTVRRERSAHTGMPRTNSAAPELSEFGWFRSIVDQVRLCDSRIEHSQVAEEVLPRLRTQIGAEAVAWVREVPGAATELAPQPIIVWCGHSVVSDAECAEIVCRYGRRATLKPAVCDMSEMPSGRDWPRLSSFILVRVPDDDADGSWLLALNRQRDAWAGNRPFSNFEAGLMQVAAAVLSTHARNLGVLLDQEHVMQRVIHGMSGAIDARDAYTRGHSERVGRFAKRIGMQLGMGVEDVEQLYLTGLLHDIGKIGIPDRVLLKSGSLTDEEFGLIKQHPEIGHRILEPISELAYALPGVLHHHERIDGRGYPHGLSGEEIPFSARILAVADAFDAMTSTRTYRAAMTMQRATTILSDGCGIQWDGEIVEAFLTVLPDSPPNSAPPTRQSLSDTAVMLFGDDDSWEWGTVSMMLPEEIDDLSSAG